MKGFENVFEGMDVLVDSMLSGALSSVINRVHGGHKVQRGHHFTTSAAAGRKLDALRHPSLAHARMPSQQTSPPRR